MKTTGAVEDFVRRAQEVSDIAAKAEALATVRRRTMFKQFAAVVEDLRGRGAEYFDWKAKRWRKFAKPRAERLDLPFGRRGATSCGRRDDMPRSFVAVDGGIDCYDPDYNDYGRPPFHFTSAEGAVSWLMGSGPGVLRNYRPDCADMALPAARLRIGGREYQYGRLGRCGQ